MILLAGWNSLRWRSDVLAFRILRFRAAVRRLMLL